VKRVEPREDLCFRLNMIHPHFAVEKTPGKIRFWCRHHREGHRGLQGAKTKAATLLRVRLPSRRHRIEKLIAKSGAGEGR